jgi:hypothetical protein
MTDSSQKEAQKDIAKFSADKLMRRFRESGIVACLFVAFALHVVVLGSTSMGYIHGLVDPAWKEQQDKLKEDARRAKAAKAAENARPAAPAATRPALPPANAGKAKSPATSQGERKLPAELTTMPKPGEIPSAPGAGIGIDETESNK